MKEVIMRKCDWCKHYSECSGSKREECIINDWKYYSFEDESKHAMIEADKLISEILKGQAWLDGNCLVISRDSVIDTIERMKGR